MPAAELNDHVTLVLLLPVTEAVNCCVAPPSKAADVGETLTETVDELDVVLAYA